MTKTLITSIFDKLLDLLLASVDLGLLFIDLLFFKPAELYNLSLVKLLLAPFTFRLYSFFRTLFYFLQEINDLFVDGPIVSFVSSVFTFLGLINLLS